MLVWKQDFVIGRYTLSEIVDSSNYGDEFFGFVIKCTLSLKDNPVDLCPWTASLPLHLVSCKMTVWTQLVLELL